MRRTSALGLALTLTAAVTLTGCSGDAEPKKKAATSASPTESVTSIFNADEPDTVHGLPVKFDSDRETMFPETGVQDVALTETRLITAGATEMIARSVPELKDIYSISSVDEANYTDVWVSPDETTGYALAQRTVPGSGTKLGKEYYSLQQFDVETGDVNGTASIELKQSSGGAGAFRIGFISAVDGTDVVVGVDGGDALPSSTVVFDMNKGRIRWDEDGKPLGVANNLVIISRGTNSVPGDIIGVDLAKGKQAWTASTAAKTSALLGSSGNVALIALTDAYFNAAMVIPVSLKTGKAPKNSDKPIQTTALTCRPAATNRSVCSSPDGTVLAWDLKKNKLLWSLPTKGRRAPLVTNVVDDLVYGFLGDTSVVLDAKTGDDVVTVAGAAPTDVNKAGGVYTYMGAAIFVPAYDATAPAPSTAPSEESESSDPSVSPQESSLFDSTEPTGEPSPLFPTPESSD